MFIPLRRFGAGDRTGTRACWRVSWVVGRRLMQSKVAQTLRWPWPSWESRSASPQNACMMRPHHLQSWQPEALTGPLQPGQTTWEFASVSFCARRRSVRDPCARVASWWGRGASCSWMFGCTWFVFLSRRVVLVFVGVAEPSGRPLGGGAWRFFSPLVASCRQPSAVSSQQSAVSSQQSAVSSQRSALSGWVALRRRREPASASAWR